MNKEQGYTVINQTQDGSSRLPSNELDYQMMMVDGRWGDPNIPEDLKERLQHTKMIRMAAGSAILNDKGEEIILDEEMLMPASTFLWSELSFYTRDFRLANLDERDYKKAVHYSLIASDCLRIGMHRAFTVALSRVAALLELSQSKKGFLRDLLGKKHAVETHREIVETPNLIMPKKNR